MRGENLLLAYSKHQLDRADRRANWIAVIGMVLGAIIYWVAR